MRDGSSPALSCDRVTKRFGHLTALRSVSLAVSPGESVVLFGRNGAGKSTLLGVSSGLIRSYEGQVSRFSVDLRKARDDDRRHIGLVSHESFLYDDLTALDNLRFYAKLYRLDQPGTVASSMLDRFGLSAKGDATVRELSRGMKQRLSLARALLHQPKLLLLDEPFTGLDEPACEMLSELLRSFVSDGGAALVTTHDIDRGFAVADRLVVLDAGRVVHEADTAAGATAFRDTYRSLLAES